MMKLLKLKMRHAVRRPFGVIEPAESVASFIKQHLRANT